MPFGILLQPIINKRLVSMINNVEIITIYVSFSPLLILYITQQNIILF